MFTKQPPPFFMFKNGTPNGKGSYINKNLYYQIDTNTNNSIISEKGKFFTGQSSTDSQFSKIKLLNKGKLRLADSNLILEGNFSGEWNESMNYSGSLKNLEVVTSPSKVNEQTNDNFISNYQSSLEALEGAVPVHQRWSELFTYTAESVLELPSNAAEVSIIPTSYDAKNVWRKIQKCLRNVPFEENYKLDISCFYKRCASVEKIEGYLEFALGGEESVLNSHPLGALRWGFFQQKISLY